MRVLVKKWGNSASVRIPAAVMEAAHLSLDDTVDVREEDGRIVIERVRPRYTLDELLAQCDPSQPLSDDEREWVDTPPAGGELL